MDRGKIPLNIYIDLSKAFDTLNFEILLDKLAYYGIKGIANSLIRSYLTNRKQIVEYDNILSNLLIVKSGVPQGSVLGPLLFYNINIVNKIYVILQIKDLQYLSYSL